MSKVMESRPPALYVTYLRAIEKALHKRADTRFAIAMEMATLPVAQQWPTIRLLGTKATASLKILLHLDLRRSGQWHQSRLLATPLAA